MLTEDETHRESDALASVTRLALGVAYAGQAYEGWQSQPHGRTVQDQLERALTTFAGTAIRTVCAGRTDTGVHACNQVVHLDAPVQREPFSWVRGTNRYLSPDIAVQWCQPVSADFHARNSARARSYAYVLLESSVRPAVEAFRCGWVFRPLDGQAMREAAALVVGEHDFSAFRAAQCQAHSPVKHLHSVRVAKTGHYWRFDFEANAFLHHMVRNLMGCLVAIGAGQYPPAWIAQVLASRSRKNAAPTFSASGLYFLGPRYDSHHGIATHTPAMDWLP